ncbi:ATP-dependent zinc protease family protein [Pannonibacter tanglangensis]|nr:MULTISPECIES: RimK/LysX family protein [unclassified Pannonibacter]NBN64729.1 ATP-dependent zinc protease [Pannonibacter sp. XCT-34]
MSTDPTPSRSSATPTELDGKLVVGWKEWVSLPDLGVPRLMAKFDTGARSSALHVPRAQVIEIDGRAHVNFDLDTDAPDAGGLLRHTAPLLDLRRVKSSSGHAEQRLTIHTTLSFAGLQWQIELTLTDRSDMKLPMLVGRSAMHSRLIIDPSRSFLAGRRVRKPSQKSR